MKKLLLLSFVACAILSPLTLSAQKKVVAKRAVPPTVALKTSADSISYALGVSIAQNGLKQYLYQLNVLADTTALNTDYATKIDQETDAVKKAKLNKELIFKLDSVNKANSKNMDDFLAGFNQTLNQNKSQSAFNSGVAVGSQVSAMIVGFSKEVLGGEGKFNSAALAAAFSNSLKEEKLLIDNSETIMQNASQKAQEVKEAEMAKDMEVEYASQIAEGKLFMENNKTKDGVVTLPSGLQYKVITKGTGAVPTATDRVTVHYTGKLIDGTVFDSSVERGEPTTFGVTQVIKGWTEALQLMPVGSKWMLYIPYNLAYGAKDQGAIKPFSNLIFEVELIEIEK